MSRLIARIRAPGVTATRSSFERSAERPTDPVDGVDIVRGISGQPGCAAPQARAVTRVATPT